MWENFSNLVKVLVSAAYSWENAEEMQFSWVSKLTKKFSQKFGIKSDQGCQRKQEELLQILQYKRKTKDNVRPGLNRGNRECRESRKNRCLLWIVLQWHDQPSGISDTGDQGKECWKTFICSSEIREKVKSKLKNTQENLTSSSHSHSVVSLLITQRALTAWKDVLLRN